MENQKKKYTEDGLEIMDSTPVAIPVRFRRELSLTEKIRDIIRNEASRAAEAAGFETFDEADDFDCDDEYEPLSPYEQSLDQEIRGNGYDAEILAPFRERTRNQERLAREKEDAERGDTSEREEVETGGERPPRNGSKSKRRKQPSSRDAGGSNLEE